METNIKTCNNCGNIPIMRGDVWLANLEGLDPYQRGIVPVICMQNNIGNKYSPTTIVIVNSVKLRKDKFTEKVSIKSNIGIQTYLFDCTLITTIDKKRLIKPIIKVNKGKLLQIERKVAKATIGLYKLYEKIG
ncbi:type II toxin-antitoxin system PemK/MazF family toxin [Lysinibacillus telephonicus]|uniref:type II toxin-antitoxin system PemK/MazF family toxin n=1 Tax=Lysinibacillus telephonicus TaxID=1714840 RepID=UPI003977FDE3